MISVSADKIYDYSGLSLIPILFAEWMIWGAKLNQGLTRNSSKNLHGMSSEGQMPIWKNPVLEGQRYFNLHLSGDYPTYETIAKKFGVSRARICQMIALAKNLPDEITGLFSDSKYLTRLHHITERKLRLLTLMKSNSEKIKAFEKLRGSKTNTL